LQLSNFMEDAVKNALEEMLRTEPYRSSGFDEKMKLDIMAYALNRLPPKYVVSEKGHLFTRVNELRHQFNTDIVVELSKAIEYVKAHPR
jgi:competence protein ComFB